LDGELVDSLPNEVPLTKEGSIFSLAVETLLAYYGLNHQHVKVSQDRKKFTISGLDGEEIIEAPLSDGQWLEVNYFSKWTEQSEVDQLYRKAKKHFSDGDRVEYLKLVPKVLRELLSQIDDFELPDLDKDLPQTILDLGVEEEFGHTGQQTFKCRSQCYWNNPQSRKFTVGYG
jgi:hypothetical protein